ncbi:hypothetical protein B484DRAFT_453093 [Ochromonadaceae sp. CCMP2298]|nr:hypothetical protein B484DRAFT_453093 [Ochromonadaceae sp. CCMP2298]
MSDVESNLTSEAPPENAFLNALVESERRRLALAVRADVATLTGKKAGQWGDGSIYLPQPRRNTSKNGNISIILGDEDGGVVAKVFAGLISKGLGGVPFTQSNSKAFKWTDVPASHLNAFIGLQNPLLEYKCGDSYLGLNDSTGLPEWSGYEYKAAVDTGTVSFSLTTRRLTLKLRIYLAGWLHPGTGVLMPIGGYDSDED